MTKDNLKSLQQRYAPNSVCYGCGPANEKGLQINSFVEGDHIVAQFKPKAYMHAFDNVLSGGVIGTLLDCHCNWTAIWYYMQANNLNEAPASVTAEFTIKLLRITPMDTTLRLVASCDKIDAKRLSISGRLMSGADISATCDALFVIVNEGHPAYNRFQI